MSQPIDYDPEADSADSVDFKHMELSEELTEDDEQDCPGCGWELDEAGDCNNPACPESELYDEDEASLDEDEDE